MVTSLTPHAVRKICDGGKNEGVSYILQIFKIKEFDQKQKFRVKYVSSYHHN